MTWGAVASAMLLAGGVAWQEIRRVSHTRSVSRRALVDAVAVTLFPGNPGPPGDAVGVGDFVERYLVEGVEPRESRLLRALFAAIEWGAVLAGGVRFTRQSPAQRRAFLAALEQRGGGLLRAAMLALKSVISMAYLGDPAVLEVAGIERLCGGAR
jgi:hypothetical protein